MCTDQLPYVLRSVIVEMAPHGSADHGLDLGGRHSGDRARELGLALRENGRRVVPVLRTRLSAVARGHAVTSIVEDPPQQHGLGVRSLSNKTGALLAQSALHRLEQVAVKDGLVFPGIDLAT